MRSNYRQLPGLNASMVKLFNKNPRKFYKEFVLRVISVEEEESFSLLLGEVVDDILLSHKGDIESFEATFDEKYILFSQEKGTGQAFIFAEYLYILTMQDTVDNIITTSFIDRCEKAFLKTQQEGKYKGKTLEWAMKDFKKSPAYIWFEQKLLSTNKKVIDLSILSKAKSIVHKTMNDENIAPIIQNPLLQSHFIIEWEYVCLSGDIIKCKSELDGTVIDDKNKTILFFDNKISWESENFQQSYLKYKYYLQITFYYLAIQWWRDKYKKEYTILLPQFLIEDISGDNLKPLLCTLTEKDIHSGLHGFSIQGKKYKGLLEILEEINWALSNDIFDISRENYNNNNKIQLNINYD